MYHWICVQFAHTCISSRIIPLATPNPLLYAAQSSLYVEKRPFNWRIILLEINLREWFHSNVQSIHAHDAKLHAWLMHVHYNPSASINPAAKKKLLLLVSLLLLMDPLSLGTHDWLLSERRERKLNSGSRSLSKPIIYMWVAPLQRAPRIKR